MEGNKSEYEDFRNQITSMKLQNETIKFCKDIKISNHAFITGLYHSLLTDEEEIMGLLIGLLNIIFLGRICEHR